MGGIGFCYDKIRVNSFSRPAAVLKTRFAHISVQSPSGKSGIADYVFVKKLSTFNFQLDNSAIFELFRNYRS